jgi:hypothetical protein
MQGAVYDRRGHVGGQLGADDDVPQLERPGRIGRGRAVDRERQNVRAGVAPAVLAVELADALGLDELDRQVPLLDPGRRECEPAQLLDVADLQALRGQLRADDLDLEQG